MEGGDSVCDSTFTCFNTEGSYYCVAPTQLSCTAGYKPNEEGTICVDVNECEEGTHSCAAGSTCINELGAYRCFDPIDCEPGFEPSQDQKRCEDINECVWPGLNTCGAGSTCHNTAGGYRCDCLHGFVESNDVTSDGKTMCQDVDECSSGLVVHKCQHECVNNPGSYSCSCPPGYQVTGFGRQCQDIDECAVNTHNCSDAETCFNTKGGFKCVELTCPAHYGKLIKRDRTYVKCVDNEPCTDFSCSPRPRLITYVPLSMPSVVTLAFPELVLRIRKDSRASGFEARIVSGNQDEKFLLETGRSLAKLSLVNEINGPWSTVLEIEAREIYRQTQDKIKKIVIYVFVSQYTF